MYAEVIITSLFAVKVETPRGETVIIWRQKLVSFGQVAPVECLYSDIAPCLTY